MTLLELWAASQQPAGAHRPLGDQRRAQRAAGAHPLPAAAAADGDPAGDRPRARPALLRPRGRARHADRLPSAAAARRGAGRQQQDPGLGRPVAAVRRCSPPISAWMFVRAATRVPDPRLGIWLDRQFDRLGPAAAAAARRGCGARMSVLARLPQPHVPRALPGRPVRDHRLRHRHRPDRRRPRAGAARPKAPSPRACAISGCGCRSCCPSSCRSRPCWPGSWRSPTCCATAS